MAEDNKNLNAEDQEVVKADKKSKEVKKDNFFKRAWRKIKKFCTDTVGEMKKVVWTPKNELKKSTILVVVSVLAIAIVIAVVDTAFSFVINGIAGLISLA